MYMRLFLENETFSLFLFLSAPAYFKSNIQYFKTNLVSNGSLKICEIIMGISAAQKVITVSVNWKSCIQQLQNISVKNVK